MPSTCPNCGFISIDPSPRFCSSCGSRMDGGSPETAAVIPELKNETMAGLCSSVLPGLGQVYNGETKKGFALFLLALAGLVALIIPGLIVWSYAMYDAYAVAGKMNAGELEFRPVNTIHLIIFVIFALAIIVIAVVMITIYLISNLMAELGPDGTQYLRMLV